MKLLETISMDFDVTDRLLIRYSAFVMEMNWEYNGTVLQLLINFMKVYGSVK
jgi:hypothetical protein